MRRTGCRVPAPAWRRAGAPRASIAPATSSRSHGTPTPPVALRAACRYGATGAPTGVLRQLSHTPLARSSSGGGDESATTAGTAARVVSKRIRKRRAVVPEDEDIASLLAESPEAAAPAPGGPTLTVAPIPMYFGAPGSSEADAAGFSAMRRGDTGGVEDDLFGDEDDEDDKESGPRRRSHAGGEGPESDIGDATGMGSAVAASARPHGGGYRGAVDPLLAGAGGTAPEPRAAGALSVDLSFVDAPARALIVERQEALAAAPVEQMVDLVCAYLRATENIKMVSANEEHVLFPVLVDRLSELSVMQLLDVVECHWARSTLLRYGTHFKDLVRDRIAVIATEAGRQREEKRLAAESGADGDGAVDGDGARGARAGWDADDGAAGGAQPGGDAVLARAVDEMNPDTVLRCIVVMGMSAGRRKRDLEFFQVLGAYFVFFINHYKNPRDLVRVLTAFARAKIVPSSAFLGLLGRRFAVLNKKVPLGALPSYRAFANLYRMGYDQMNPFRFLADRIFETVEENLKIEKKRIRLRELQLEQSKGAGDGGAAAGEADGAAARPAPETLSIAVAVEGDVVAHLSSSIAARQRFQLITELKPPMFTKLLLVLARFGAPHQQYLRPVIQPLLLPTFRHFPPPSFARLLRVLRLFHTSDREILEPIVDFMADDLGPGRVLLHDLLEMLRLMGHPDTPMLRNFEKMMRLCEQVFSTRVNLRAMEMCNVAGDLLAIQRKDDVPLEAVDALTALMETFAERMCFLMDLGVLSLTHAEVLYDICRQLQHPDANGKIEALRRKRRDVNLLADGDEGYYSSLDIDVRETFHKIQIVNSFNTFGAFRPTPGALQVDFKQALTEVSAEVILEAAHLHEQAFPRSMIPTVARHLSRSVLAKIVEEGEEVVTPDNVIEVRPRQPIYFTAESLLKFARQLQLTPLKRVRNSVPMWAYTRSRAAALKQDSVVAMANAEIARILQQSCGAAAATAPAEGPAEALPAPAS